MKRSRHLTPLSSEHHQALLVAFQLKKSLAGHAESAGAPKDLPGLVALARRFLGTVLAPHVAAEEELLTRHLPAAGRAAAGGRARRAHGGWWRRRARRPAVEGRALAGRLRRPPGAPRPLGGARALPGAGGPRRRGGARADRRRSWSGGWCWPARGRRAPGAEPPGRRWCGPPASRAGLRPRSPSGTGSGCPPAAAQVSGSARHHAPCPPPARLDPGRAARARRRAWGRAGARRPRRRPPTSPSTSTSSPRPAPPPRPTSPGSTPG